ncbi:MAG: hypothetical protein R6X25_05815 [Candidatus Krumholzibacteriia bacterium]
MLESYRARNRLGRLIGDWREYREVVAAARGIEVTSEQENGFRELEARIASRLRSVQDLVPAMAADEARREFAAMTDLLKRQRSLKEAASAESADPEGFERFWHEHYIFLNQLKGLELGRAADRTNGRRRAAAAVPGGTEKRWGRLRDFPVKRAARWLAIVAVLAIVGHLTIVGMGLRYNTVIDRFVTDSQSGVALVIQDALNSVLDFFAGVVRFFDPVILAYGPAWAAILFVILALSVAYWMFVRG